ncbi:MAG: glucose 1-dehydrogenase [Candidatus Pacearchaeota archaeon]|nr:glucose 1-dehydrogenase [Candidatus Pacearchaeota archaeon]
MAGAQFRVKEDKLRLKGKVAIITGGTSGIGLATAILFAKEGAKVVVASRDSDAGKIAIEQIKANNGDGIFVKTDVSNEDDVKILVAEALRKYKKLDILFNNAGIELQKPVVETSGEELSKVLDINLKGVFYGCKYAIPYMIRNGGGSIINNASSAGLVGFPNLAAYSASKGGVIALTKQIAIDYAKSKIRVNCICPGAIETPMIERFISKSPEPEETRKSLNEMHPLGRIGKAEEVANAVLFLASDESSFITGHILVVDGGLTAQ